MTLADSLDLLTLQNDFGTSWWYKLIDKILNI